MENDSKDFFVCTTTNSELAGAVRKELHKHFERLWVCVVNSGQDVYRVSVANTWGSRLDKNQENNISLFVQKYLDEQAEPEEEETFDECLVNTREFLKKVLTECKPQEDE